MEGERVGEEIIFFPLNEVSKEENQLENLLLKNIHLYVWSAMF